MVDVGLGLAASDRPQVIAHGDALPELSSNRTSARHLADVRAVVEDPSRAVVFD